MTVGVAYDANLSKVRDVLKDLISKESRVHADPEPVIVVGELADNSVNFIVRLWTNTGDYWGVKFDLTEAIKNRFDDEGIGIPFPQRDIHIVSGQLA
jgi:small conductance mechanosensitive channel